MTKIYTLKHPDTNEIRYVGKTIQQLKYRLATHISRSKKYRYAYVNCWIYSLLQEGKKPIIELIEEVENNQWEEKEIYWIQYYSTRTRLTNFQLGGGHSNVGKELKEEHKKAISESLKGKPRDEKTKRKISESHKGKVLSESTKQKLRDYNLGKSISLETKIKMSKGGIEQYNKEGILLNTYISLQEAATQTGLFKGNISSACTGRLKTYGGFKWKYKNEDIV